TIVGSALGLVSYTHPEEWTAFIAVIQLGTLLAVLMYFSRDIMHISTAFIRESIIQRTPWHKQSLESRMGWYVIIGTLPIVTLGILLKSIIEGSITKDIRLIAWTLIILALVLLAADIFGKQTRTSGNITWRDALIIGIAQALALFPGASRSGTTITAGLFLGLQRAVAARFSFLLSIPAVFASGILQLYQSFAATASYDPTTLLVATTVSGISGYAAIAFLLRYLQTHSTGAFVVYRILLGTYLLVFWRSPVV
ncbi:MAG: undecaprenyl-diphosphate phosphatase, partial [Bacteroidota bacterium]|nr:UDP-diphosphatase [Candidatus Kapabacteria bacterium]MDW8220765.1 undecaprenyl-diphosphate phosphatase [Bacteroidota bacterium]